MYEMKNNGNNDAESNRLEFSSLIQGLFRQICIFEGTDRPAIYKAFSFIYYDYTSYYNDDHMRPVNLKAISQFAVKGAVISGSESLLQ